MGDSKSMRAVYLSMSLGLLLVAVGIAVYVVYDKEVVELIALGLGKLGFDGGASVYRSVKVDAPIRQANAAVDVAIRAKEADVAAPVMTTVAGEPLQTWTPPQEGQH